MPCAPALVARPTCRHPTYVSDLHERRHPRLGSTRAGVHHLNSVYGVYLRPGSIRTGQDLLPIASLNSMSMLGAETIGRAYGAAC